MAMKLEDQLALYGCTMDATAFRDMLTELHQNMHPSWTVDELLCHPYDALRFCHTVRGRTTDGLPDDFILRNLLNTRKH